MKATVALGIRDHAITGFIVLPAARKILGCTLRKVILIDKVIAGIVGRINVYHLDLAKVGLLQQFQDFQIIALNVEVLAVNAAGRTVLPDTVRNHRAESGSNRCIRRKHGLPLIRPSELIALLAPLHNAVRELLPEHIKINGALCLPVAQHLGHRVREKRRDGVNVSGDLVEGVKF